MALLPPRVRGQLLSGRLLGVLQVFFHVIEDRLGGFVVLGLGQLIHELLLLGLLVSELLFELRRKCSDLRLERFYAVTQPGGFFVWGRIVVEE